MNPAAAHRRMAERLSGTSRQQLALRGAIALGTLGVLALIALSGGVLSPVWAAIVVLVAVVTMLIPHDFAPLVLLGGLAGLWAISVPDLLHPSTILAAALLFGIHVACALTSYGPPELVLDTALLRLWAGRAAQAAGAAAAVWLAAQVLARTEPPGAEWVRIVALGLLLGWTAFLTTRLLRP